MRKTVLIGTVMACLMAMLLAVPAWAGNILSCDPQAGVTVYALEADGQVVTTEDPETPLLITATLEGALWYSIPEDMGAGSHTFRAMCANTDNWWSGWSEPYTATRPNKPFGLKLTLTLEITQ